MSDDREACAKLAEEIAERAAKGELGLKAIGFIDPHTAIYWHIADWMKELARRIRVGGEKQAPSKWDEVGALFQEISTLRGGPEKLYKPVVRIEYYEHDGIVNVAVGRCKGMDDIAASAQVWEDQNYQYTQPDDQDWVKSDRIATAILAALKECREKLGDCR